MPSRLRQHTLDWFWTQASKGNRASAQLGNEETTDPQVVVKIQDNLDKSAAASFPIESFVESMCARDCDHG